MKKVVTNKNTVMSEVMHDFIVRQVKVLDLLLVTLPFALVWIFYYGERIAAPYYRNGNLLIIVLFAVLYTTYGRIYDGFLISYLRISEMIYSQAIAAIVSDLIMYILIWFLARHIANPLPLLGALGLQLLAVTIWSTLAHRWYFRTFPPLKSVIVYDMREGLEKVIEKHELSKKFRIVKTLQTKECLRDLTVLDGIECVFVSGVHSHERTAILKYCIANDIQMYVIPQVGDILMSAARNMHMLHLPVLCVRRYCPRLEFLVVKRLFDIVVSGTALIVLSPVFLVTAVMIKRCDGGPVFYRQRRLTKDGREFMIYKFRSMRVDAEKDGVARLSTGEKDDRITPVGRFIRAHRIDELPQLLNILSGSLSIVGPRPERPEIAEQYEREMPEFRLRLQAKAGLTGYAQVYGKYNTTPYDKLQMDLMYIAHASFAEDLKIMFATVKILFIPESTEGIDEGKTTA